VNNGRYYKTLARKRHAIYDKLNFISNLAELQCNQNLHWNRLKNRKVNDSGTRQIKEPVLSGSEEPVPTPSRRRGVRQ